MIPKTEVDSNIALQGKNSLHVPDSDRLVCTGLQLKDIFLVLKKSLTAERGLANYNIKIEDSTLEKIAETSNGDVRTALNGLEVAVLTTQMDKDGYITITDEIAKECVQERKAIFDKNGDSHYDNISAFIKSMRGK